MILLIDDLETIHSSFKKTIATLGISLELKSFTKIEDFKMEIENLKKSNRLGLLKALIIDLSNSKEEETTKKFSASEVISESFNNNSIPIFIHSGYLEYYDDFKEYGTVIRVKKNDESIVDVCKQIKLMLDSGFLEIFGQDGLLQKTFDRQIHESFTEQFKGSEIRQILDSIFHNNGNNQDAFKKRTIDTFSRIAIRTLYQNLLSAKKIDEAQSIEEIKINVVEHYYRRKSDFKIWTGDIFENSKDNSQIVILTPRCDINNNNCKDKFICCQVTELDDKLTKEISREPDKFLTDNPMKSGIRNRFLVPAPNYRGGKVDLSDYFFVNKSDFEGTNPNFKYLISLSDELTNEIVRKFAAYILRGGISASEINEARFYSMEAKESISRK